MWVPYDDTYEVYVDGQVRNRKTGRVLKPGTRGKNKNYKWVDLAKVKWSLHRLVAHCFLPRVIIDNHQVHHINHDTTDNRAENLIWVSNQQNIRLNETHNIVVYDGKYRVRFRKDKVNIFLKSFETYEEAVEARDAFKSGELFRLSL